MSVIMPGEGSLEPLAQRLVEPLPGKARRDVFGLAPACRDDARGEDGGKRRHALEGAVAMPELIGLVAQRKPMVRRHNLAVLVNGAENDKIGTDSLRSDLGYFERPEAARKSKLRLVCYILAAKDEHQMLLEGGAHRLVGAIVGRDIAKRDAAQLGRKARTHGNDFHRRSPSGAPPGRAYSKNSCLSMIFFRKPVPTPHQVRGRLFRDHALVSCRADSAFEPSSVSKCRRHPRAPRCIVETNKSCSR